jgi:hypothetical protein
VHPTAPPPFDFGLADQVMAQTRVVLSALDEAAGVRSTYGNRALVDWKGLKAMQFYRSEVLVRAAAMLVVRDLQALIVQVRVDIEAALQRAADYRRAVDQYTYDLRMYQLAEIRRQQQLESTGERDAA